MILRNHGFQNDLEIQEDHVHTIQVESPRLLARFIQSLAALEQGEPPIEPFVFLQDGKALDAGKFLRVVTDPFTMDLNNRKNLTALYSRIESNMHMEPESFSKWMRAVYEVAALIKTFSADLSVDIAINDEPTFATLCKQHQVKFAEPPGEQVYPRLLRLLDITAEFASKSVLVLCNLSSFLPIQDLHELMKYACYTKVRLMIVDSHLPDALYENEIRWTIHSDFSDEITKM